MSANIKYLISVRHLFSERDYVTFAMLSQFRLSVVCLSVCDVGALYSAG